MTNYYIINNDEIKRWNPKGSEKMKKMRKQMPIGYQ